MIQRRGRALPVLGQDVSPGEAIVSPPKPHDPISVSPPHLRLRMLLVDKIGPRWYLFDPETGDSMLVSEQIAAAIVSHQGGQDLAEDVVQALHDQLGLGVVPIAYAAREIAEWAMTIHLNHACNLACEYCYADGRTSDANGTAKGAYGGPVTYMSQAVLENAAEKFMRDAPASAVVVGFCGGEPLLSEHRFLEAVQVMDERAEKHGRQVRYELTTNATRITPAIVGCLKTHRFSVAVSVDGDRETHDRQRPMATGKGSYDSVMQGLHSLVKAGILVGVRMTAFRDRPGLERNHYALTATPAPVANFKFNMYDGDARRPLEGEERTQLFGHYLDVARRILGGDPAAAKLTAIRDVISGIVTKRKRQFQCGAGRWDRAITPAGDVFPCHRFVGMSPYKLGNVLSDSFRFQSYALFETNSVRNRVFRHDGTKNCALCYAHHVCGGGCAQIAAANSGRIGELPPFYCEETRLRVQASVRALVEKLHPELADAST